MKNLLSIAAIMMFTLSTFSQEVKEVPSVMLKSMKGEAINSSSFDNEGKPYIINFWATWCSPCKRELNAIAEVYEDWVEETGVKIIAISIDDTRTSKSVKPYVDASGWEYEVYLDENGDFKRAMNVTAPPYTFLVDATGNIVYQHIGYNPGDEEELYEELMKLMN
jgi:cytochrome c biogenesis protein CcmG, thiol:disulfide interchange protein DsbE